MGSEIGLFFFRPTSTGFDDSVRDAPDTPGSRGRPPSSPRTRAANDEIDVLCSSPQDRMLRAAITTRLFATIAACCPIGDHSPQLSVICD